MHAFTPDLQLAASFVLDSQASRRSTGAQNPAAWSVRGPSDGKKKENGHLLCQRFQAVYSTRYKHELPQLHAETGLQQLRTDIVGNFMSAVVGAH
jgi:hypothetical protein